MSEGGEIDEAAKGPAPAEHVAAEGAPVAWRGLTPPRRRALRPAMTLVTIARADGAVSWVVAAPASTGAEDFMTCRGETHLFSRFPDVPARRPGLAPHLPSLAPHPPGLAPHAPSVALRPPSLAPHLPGLAPHLPEMTRGAPDEAGRPPSPAPQAPNLAHEAPALPCKKRDCSGGRWVLLTRNPRHCGGGFFQLGREDSNLRPVG